MAGLLRATVGCSPTRIALLAKPRHGPAGACSVELRFAKARCGVPSFCRVDASERLRDLVERYSRMVRSSVARVAGRHDDDLGDEIIQQVSEALWKQLRGEKHIEHPASYLYRCAVRETVKQLRRQVAHVPLDEVAIANEHGSPEDTLRARQVEDATRAILGDLKPDRAAAVSAHLAGFSVEEIMHIHGWQYQRARNLIARGLAQLRTELMARGIS